MSKFVPIFVVSIFAAANATLADEGPKEGAKAYRCPARSNHALPEDLVFRNPNRNFAREEEEHEASAKAQQQCDEWQRKWTGIPKGTWDKMTGEQKDKAFDKARSGSKKASSEFTPKDQADTTVIPLSTMSANEANAARAAAWSKWDNMRSAEQNAVLKNARTKSWDELTALDEIALRGLRHPIGVANA